MDTMGSTPEHRSIVGWLVVWVRTIARSWRMRARHIGSNIP